MNESIQFSRSVRKSEMKYLLEEEEEFLPLEIPTDGQPFFIPQEIGEGIHCIGGNTSLWRVEDDEGVIEHRNFTIYKLSPVEVADDAPNRRFQCILTVLSVFLCLSVIGFPFGLILFFCTFGRHKSWRSSFKSNIRYFGMNALVMICSRDPKKVKCVLESEYLPLGHMQCFRDLYLRQNELPKSLKFTRISRLITNDPRNVIDEIFGEDDSVTTPSSSIRSTSIRKKTIPKWKKEVRSMEEFIPVWFQNAGTTDDFKRYWKYVNEVLSIHRRKFYSSTDLFRAKETLVLEAFNYCRIYLLRKQSRDGLLDSEKLKLGHIHMFLGEISESVSCFTTLIRQTHRCCEKVLESAFFDRGYLHLQLKRFDEAVSDFSDVITFWERHNKQNKDKLQNPYVVVEPDGFPKAPGYSSFPSLYYRGLAYLNNLKYVEAMNDFKACLESKPAVKVFVYRCYNHIGTSHFRMGSYEKAERYLRVGIRVFQENDEAYCTIGEICSEKGMYDEAMSNFDKSISINPYNARAAFQRGKIFVQVKEVRKGFADLSWAEMHDINNEYPTIRRMKRELALKIARGDWIKSESEKIYTLEASPKHSKLIDKQREEVAKKLIQDLQDTKFKDYEILRRVSGTEKTKMLGNGKGATYIVRLRKSDDLYVMKLLFNYGFETSVLRGMRDAETKRFGLHENTVCQLHSFIGPLDYSCILDFNSEKCEDETLVVLLPYHQQTLSSYMIRRKLLKLPVSEKEVRYVMQQLLRCLKYLSSETVTHRNISPDTIFVDDELCRVRIGGFVFGSSIDFKRFERDGKRGKMQMQMEAEDFKDMEILKANYFVSPEIASCERGENVVLDYFKSDVFAVGMVGYLMLSDEDPFGGVDGSKRTQEMYVELPETVSLETREFVKNLCRVDPAMRPGPEEACMKLEVQNVHVIKLVKEESKTKVKVVHLENKATFHCTVSASNSFWQGRIGLDKKPFILGVFENEKAAVGAIGDFEMLTVERVEVKRDEKEEVSGDVAFPFVVRSPVILDVGMYYVNGKDVSGGVEVYVYGGELTTERMKRLEVLFQQYGARGVKKKEPTMSQTELESREKKHIMLESVKYKEKMKNQSGVYEVYEAPNAKTAQEFLKKYGPVTQGLYYVVVETPNEGSWGRDIDGIYEE